MVFLGGGLRKIGAGVGEMEVERTVEDGARLVQSPELSTQGVVLVVLEVNKDICTRALNWAFDHVVRRGDTIRLVGILSHVLNPSELLNLPSSATCMQ